MKLTCNRDKFSTLFSLAAAVVSAKDIKAVLQNVKMTVKSNKLILDATDMDNSIRLVLDEVDILDEGETILPTRMMKNVIQESNADILEISLEDEKLTVRAGNAFYQFPTQPVEEFPEIPPFESEAYHEVQGKVLLDHIRRTSFAIDLENSKYTLSGVLFELTEGRIATVSTDGRRLANQEGVATAYGGHFSENSAIVPLKALNLVEKAFGQTAEPVKIAIEEGKITFATSNITISARLVEGRFPRWKNILPNKLERTKVDIAVSALYQCVRQTAFLATDSQPGVILHFEAGQLEITATGEGNSAVPTPISYDSEPIEVKLDPHYLSDFLRCLPSEAILSIYLKEKQSVLFETNDGYSYVLMPLA